MGLLRLLLTMTVVLVHAGQVAPVGGRIAVQVFFLISGYVIALVLNEKQISAPDFYVGRVLKIYPEYLLILMASVIILPLLGQVLPVVEGYEGAVAASSVLIVGQDWLMFTPNQHHGLLLPQTWAIGTEITFYALAPFVVRSPRRMAALFAASVMLRIGLLLVGVGQEDPWTFRFFPTELAIFMAGALAYRFLPKSGGSGIAATTTAMAVLMLTPLTGAFPIFTSALVLGAVAVLLPGLVQFDAAHKWSRTIGDACFAVFLVHILALKLAAFAMKPEHAVGVGIAGSVITGVALRYGVSIPADPYRKKLAQWMTSRRLRRETPPPTANTVP